MGRPIETHEKDPVEGLENCLLDPSAAQLQLWHAQSQRDHGMISGKELAIVEKLTNKEATKARTIYNPYTGEIRKAYLPEWYWKKGTR